MSVPVRQATSYPATKAVITSFGVAPISSASASSPGSTATVGWPRIARLTSSKSSACEAVPLSKAAFIAEVPSGEPTSDATDAARSARRSSRSICTAGSPAPGSVTANQSRMHWRARVTAASGRTSYVIPAARSASQCVTGGGAAMSAMDLSLHIGRAIELAQHDLVDLTAWKPRQLVHINDGLGLFVAG